MSEPSTYVDRIAENLDELGDKREDAATYLFHLSLRVVSVYMILLIGENGTAYHVNVIDADVLRTASWVLVLLALSIHLTEYTGAARAFVGLCSARLHRIERRFDDRIPTRFLNRKYVVLGAIVAVGLVFRLRNLGATPLWIDEAFTSWAARNFVTGQGFSDPVGPSSPYRRGWPTTSLPIAGSFLLFGFNEFAARVPMVLYGILNIYLAYLLGSRFSRPVGYSLASVVAFNPLFVVWSRTARVYEPILFIHLLTVYLLVKWYYDSDLKLISPYPPFLGLLVILGWDTHPAYLAIGPAVLLFFAIELSHVIRRHSLSLSEYSLKNRRLAFVLAAGLLGSGIFLLVKGPPSSLLAPPPETWEQPPVTYYWDFLGLTFPFLRGVVILGIPYAWIRYKEARFLILCLILPLTIASLVPRKSSRYVYHLLPLFFIPAFVLLVDSVRVVGDRASEYLGGDRRTGRVVAYSVLVMILIVSVNPVVGYSVADHHSEPPYHAERSDWGAASDWVSQHAEPDDVVLSTRPELSMWYFGDTDYFFRQYGIQSAALKGGKLVHTRTGTVFLNSTEEVKQLIQEENETIWLFAAKKFDDDYTDPYAKEFVVRTGIEHSEPDWNNMRVYYWPEALYENYFLNDSWRTGLENWEGNVKVLEDEGAASSVLALGRTKTDGDYEIVHGENTSQNDGSITVTRSTENESLIIEARMFATEDRRAKITVSNDGEKREEIRVDSGGWQIVETRVDGGGEVSLRIESDGSSGSGVLLEYVRIRTEERVSTAENETNGAD